MKVRYGFVSNSSSESFLCQVCGNHEAGWDMSLSDAGMYMCSEQHIFCDSHGIRPLPDERYECSIIHCPICQFKHIADDDLKDYLIKKYKEDPKHLLVEIKDAFNGDYRAFYSYLKEKPKKIKAHKDVPPPPSGKINLRW